LSDSSIHLGHLTVKSEAVITFDEIRTDPDILTLIDCANEVLIAMGFTEHGRRHVGIVADRTTQILAAVGTPAREIELAQIAAHMHDIGNAIARLQHPMHGASMAFTLLRERGMPMRDIGPILGAIGNHEELTGGPVSAISAALIIADKSDVHHSRVQNPILESFDIHDRVNYAVQESQISVDAQKMVVTLQLEIDTKVATVMEYFEIFLHRMVMCRKAAEKLGLRFELCVNGTSLS